MEMSLPTVLPEADRAALIACVNRPTSPQRDVLRARIILTWPDHGMRATARLLGCAKSTVVTWRDRYRARGLPGLRIFLVPALRGLTATSSAGPSPQWPPLIRRGHRGRGRTPDWPRTSTACPRHSSMRRTGPRPLHR